MDKNDYLQAMGIQAWRLRERPFEPIIEPAAHAIPAEIKPTSNWQNLREQVQQCTLCDLHKNRTKTVFGAGNQQADLMIIGEAPGSNEDKAGEPFVGQSGLLLNEILRAIGLKRGDVFITNILKCRPPENRDPQTNETSRCTPYLKQQIELLRPKLIVAIGRISAQFLLDSSKTLKDLRGESHTYKDIPLIATYHPAYLLRSPKDKANAWIDWQKISAHINNAASATS